jgi:C4-dicarboxylate-specific signal transduction histidine kinase
VAQLLEGHRADLGNFLTNDPKGRALPQYLAELGQRLDAERVKMHAELQGLAANIEHIKEIVAMQQSYAKVSGETESLAVAPLIEDALRMNAAAFTRHGVTLQRDFAPVPFVSVDKHKVLQILINLMRNAKYAVDDIEGRQKLIKVGARLGDRGFVAISVQDNGMGIAPENLTRIFMHGFTTRKEGHGFGLHSGALAAKEMGGTLTAHSEGTDKGATFTLTLPIAYDLAVSPSTQVCPPKTKALTAAS